MRHIRIASLVLVLLVLLLSEAATAESGEAIDLLAGISAAAESVAQSEPAHPVYSLMPEPYSSDAALVIALEDLLALAIANNLGLKQQELSIEKGHYTVDQTYYSYDPQVSSSLQYSWTDPGSDLDNRHRVNSGISYSVPREYGDSFQISYDLGTTAQENVSPIYSSEVTLSYQRPLARGAGKYVNRIPRFMASNNLLLSYDRLDDEVRSLKKSVMDVFFQAVAARESIDVREASLNVALQQLERTVERYKVGLAIRAELLQAENSVLTQRAQLLDAQTYYADILDTLTVLVGLPRELALSIDADIALTDFAENLPDDLWNLVEANSFELKSLNTQLANLRLARDQQLNQLKPDMGLGISYSRSAGGSDFDPITADTGTQGVGLSVSWATTPGKRSTRANLAQAEIDLASLDLSIQDAELQLKTGLRSQQRNLTTKRQQIDIARSNLEVVEETYNIQKERNEVGLATTLDVVEAQENVLSAELALLNARVAYQQAYREILLSAGLI